jgi:hypothetical protein
MVFILLSISSFVLRTLPVFEIGEYEFLTVYNDSNSTEHTSIYVTQRREIIVAFDIIEWICMMKILGLSKIFRGDCFV